MNAPIAATICKWIAAAEGLSQEGFNAIEETCATSRQQENDKNRTVNANMLSWAFLKRADFQEMKHTLPWGQVAAVNILCRCASSCMWYLLLILHSIADDLSSYSALIQVYEYSFAMLFLLPRPMVWFNTTGLKEPQYQDVMKYAREAGIMLGRLVQLFPKDDWSDELST